MAGLSILDVDAARVACEPYTFFVGSGVLDGATVAEIRRDFPKITKPGDLTVGEAGAQEAAQPHGPVPQRYLRTLELLESCLPTQGPKGRR